MSQMSCRRFCQIAGGRAWLAGGLVAAAAAAAAAGGDAVAYVFEQ